MVKTFKLYNFKNTRLYITYSLVFFLYAVLGACKPAVPGKLTLMMERQHAVGLRIPAVMLAGGRSLPLEESIKVELLQTGNHTPVLGDLEKVDNEVVFRPLIPLWAGATYTVWQAGKQVGQIMVPTSAPRAKTRLIAVYPVQDTLPANLLKMYFRFSAPMRVGQSSDHIQLLNSKGDTLNNVFLNLQPELWDSTGTVLTLWLDPGRIKRDLQPNLRLGNPLNQGERYTVTVSGKWKDAQGQALGKSYQKQFVTGSRYDAAIDINQWKLNPPAAGTRKALKIDMALALDHFLLQESVSVLNNKGGVLQGTIKTGAFDRSLTFTPAQPWPAGACTLQVNARLEDLAGNNLNKPFDRDMTRTARRNAQVYERRFVIK